MVIGFVVVLPLLMRFRYSASAAAYSRPGMLPLGQDVILEGLTSNIEYNGRRGKILECSQGHPEKYKVRLHETNGQEKVLSLRRERIRPIIS